MVSQYLAKILKIDDDQWNLICKGLLIIGMAYWGWIQKLTWNEVDDDALNSDTF